jgi:cobyrinic acid a,c-diamide synthase
MVSRGRIEPPTRGLIVAAPASGSGKTVLTLVLLRHFRERGLAVSSFKTGPDYIDPVFHRMAGGRECFNLDPWAMRPATIAAIAGRIAEEAELVIGEGVMGLFDGAANGTGSTADLAAALGLPVVLVIDVRSQAGSAAAVVHGFSTFRGDVEIAGVVFNRAGGDNHVETIREACRGLGAPILGFLPRREKFRLPDRHLGLVQAVEHPDIEGFLDGAATAAAEHIDFAALLEATRPFRPSPGNPTDVPPALGQRIAVARDKAFSFAYPHLLEGWRQGGAEILMFSPLADEPPHESADAVFLPGGYPELHAGRLAGNTNFLEGLRKAASRDAVIYGECGGYMVLGEGLVDAGGNRHRMASLLALATSFAERRLHLGYRQMVLPADGPLGLAGSRYRGHEFHYATILDEGPGGPLFSCLDSTGKALGGAGCRRGTVMGSFLHLIDAA